MTEQVDKWKCILLGSGPLAKRFDALFELKHLASKGNDSAVEAIYDAFQDPSELLKHELAYCLGQAENKSAIPLLEKILQDEGQPEMVRHEAAEALGALDSRDSLTLLEHYKKSDSSRVIRETCDLAIDRIIHFSHSKQPHSDYYYGDHGQYYGPFVNKYNSVDPAPPFARGPSMADFREMRKTLMNPKESLFTRYRAMFTLRNYGDPLSVEALCAALDDDSALLRHEIAYIFGQMCLKSTVPALLKLLNNPKEAAMVRHEAAEALGSIGSKECVAALETFAKDKEVVVAESCVVGLGMGL